MSNATFTLQQAKTTCCQYQFLRGQKLFTEKDWSIGLQPLLPLNIRIMPSGIRPGSS